MACRWQVGGLHVVGKWSVYDRPMVCKWQDDGLSMVGACYVGGE